MELIETLPNNPFIGKGKPEKLKFNLSGFWSRRITQEHRLIYEVKDDYIRIVSCRGIKVIRLFPLFSFRIKKY